MKTIVFIGTQKSGSSREAIKAAKDLGYFTVLLTDREKQINQRLEYKDVHTMKYCKLDDFDAMKTILQQIELKAFDIKAIVSFVDSHVYTACLLAEEFGVNHFTTNAICYMEDKRLSRELLNKTPYVPNFKVLEPKKIYNKEDIEPLLPCILKSPQSTGSKDVYKINDYYVFTKAFDLFKNKYPDKKILLEEYLEGPQFLIEVLVIRGQVYIMAIVEQEIALINQHFIVTGYNININPPFSLYQKIKRAVTDIIRLHELRNGACHLELRYVNNSYKLIEINPRISGGGMNQLIKAAYGIDLAKETVKLALNQYPNIVPKYKKCAYIQYITVNKEGVIKKVKGKSRAMKHKGVLNVYVKPRIGNFVNLPKSMGHRYAYVLATGDNMDEAKQNAKEAIKEIEFEIE